MKTSVINNFNGIFYNELSSINADKVFCEDMENLVKYKKNLESREGVKLVNADTTGIDDDDIRAIRGIIPLYPYPISKDAAYNPAITQERCLFVTNSKIFLYQTGFGGGARITEVPLIGYDGQPVTQQNVITGGDDISSYNIIESAQFPWTNITLIITHEGRIIQINDTVTEARFIRIKATLIGATSSIVTIFRVNTVSEKLSDGIVFGGLYGVLGDHTTDDVTALTENFIQDNAYLLWRANARDYDPNTELTINANYFDTNMSGSITSCQPNDAGGFLMTSDESLFFFRKLADYQAAYAATPLRQNLQSRFIYHIPYLEGKTAIFTGNNLIFTDPSNYVGQVTDFPYYDSLLDSPVLISPQAQGFPVPKPAGSSYYRRNLVGYYYPLRNTVMFARLDRLVFPSNAYKISFMSIDFEASAYGRHALYAQDENMLDPSKEPNQINIYAFGLYTKDVANKLCGWGGDPVFINGQKKFGLYLQNTVSTYDSNKEIIPIKWKHIKFNPSRDEGSTTVNYDQIVITAIATDVIFGSFYLKLTAYNQNDKIVNELTIVPEVTFNNDLKEESIRIPVNNFKNPDGYVQMEIGIRASLFRLIKINVRYMGGQS